MSKSGFITSVTIISVAVITKVGLNKVDEEIKFIESPELAGAAQNSDESSNFILQSSIILSGLY